MKIPKKGDIIYLDTELYLHHGEDDILGGKATIRTVEIDRDIIWIITNQYPDVKYNWKYLEPLQDKLKNEFGNNWTHPHPDLRKEFNCCAF